MVTKLTEIVEFYISLIYLFVYSTCAKTNFLSLSIASVFEGKLKIKISCISQVSKLQLKLSFFNGGEPSWICTVTTYYSGSLYVWRTQGDWQILTRQTSPAIRQLTFMIITLCNASRRSAHMRNKTLLMTLYAWLSSGSL